MAETNTARTFSYRPLYIQVKDSLIRRLIDGKWQPGQIIPSETDLALEIGVSQGTIRKALDTMAAENLLIRRQGRGTYVAEPAESRILFQYFRIVPDDGEASFPDSRILNWSRKKATAAEREGLALPENSDVWRIARVRDLGGVRRSPRRSRCPPPASPASRPFPPSPTTSTGSIRKNGASPSPERARS